MVDQQDMVTYMHKQLGKGDGGKEGVGGNTGSCVGVCLQSTKF